MNDDHAGASPVERSVRLQGGLTNDQLRAAWSRALPSVQPTERDLTAFALGVECGASLRTDSSASGAGARGKRMGLIKAVSGDSYGKTPPRGNPDPTNNRLVRFKKFARALVVEIHYPGCNNYEGRKVMVYDGTSLASLLGQAQGIDPHFSDRKDVLSPVARFEPTDRGWQMACDLASRM